MPKLLIKSFGPIGEDVCKLEEAGYLLNFNDRIVMVEGKMVRSYDELVQLAAQDKYRDKEFIEVVLLPMVAGG